MLQKKCCCDGKYFYVTTFNLINDVTNEKKNCTRTSTEVILKFDYKFHNFSVFITS